MFSKINKAIGNIPVLRSLLFLGFAQLINFISPLLVTPYLIRTIGLEKFGIVMLAQTIMNFVIILTDYSFSLLSTQSASVNRLDKLFLNRLYNEVITTRIVLVIIGFILVFILTFTIPILAKHRLLFLISYTIVIGRSLIPVWFLLGIEESKTITYINVISKSISYAILFYLITTPSDYAFVNIVWASGEIIVGLYCIKLLKNRYDIGTQVVFSWHPIYKHLRDGWPIFLSSSLNAFYINSGLLILSLFADGRELGIYAIAERIMLLVKQLFGVIAQATYPYACRLAEESKEKFNKFLTLELYGCFCVFTILGILTFTLSDRLIYLFLGYAQPYASILLRSLAFVPLVVSLNLPTYHTFIINHFKRSYLTVITAGTVLNLLLNFCLVPTYLAMGTVITIFATEMFITGCFHIVLYARYPQHRISYFTIQNL